MRGLVPGCLAVWLLIGSLLVVHPAEAGTWTCGASSYTSDPLSEVVQNGGFESDMANWYIPAPASLPSVSTAIHHTGVKSARVYSFGTHVDAAQDLSTPPSSYVLSYWLYVATWGPGGHFAAEILRNWDPNFGTADFVTQLYWLPPNTLSWTIWKPNGGSGAAQTYARTLTTGSWHLLETVIDETTGRQCLYIDGAYLDSLTVAPASTFPGTALTFGDISWAGDAGDGYWDDLSIQALNVAQPDYVPTSPLPPGAFPAGESRPNALTISVANQASIPANASTTLAFYNETTRASPFATFVIPPLAGGSTAGPFTASWLSPGVPGIYRIVAEVDYAGAISESNEGNNRYTWTAVVYPPPITTLTLGNPNYASFITSATPLVLTASDRSGTGIQRTEYRIDSGPWRSYVGPFTVVGEGNHLIEWYSADNVGNVEATQSRTLTVDNTPPTTTGSLGSPNYMLSFVTSSTPITLTAADGGAIPVGVDTIAYRIDGGSWLSYSSPFTLAGEGAHVLDFRATDRLGNAEAIASRTLTVDNTGPTASVIAGTPSYTATDTWITSHTPVTLPATDRGVIPVGIASLEFRTWASTWGPWISYAAPFNVPPEGRRYVEWRSADHLGNPGAGNASLIVDDTPPSVSVSLAGPSHTAAGPDMWITSATRIALSAVDGGVLPVGLATIAYRTWFGGWGAWTPYGASIGLAGEGRHYLEWRATDRLGNLVQGNVSYVLDDTPPSAGVTIAGPSYAPAGDAWITSESRISLAAVDGGILPVGVATLEYRTWFAAWTAWSPYLGAVGFSTEGRHYLEWRSSDFLGNAGAGNLSFIVDDTPPTSASALTGPTVTAAAIYVTSTTQISLTAVDGGPVPVGLAKIEASTDGIAWAANTVPIVLTGADGLRTVYYRARDRLGNMETARVLVLFLDNTAPTTAIAIPDGPLSIASRFSLSAADSGSGVDRIEYRIDGGAWRPYESPFAVPIGAHTIGYRAADRLGNLEPERVATIRVENWKPMIAVLLSIILAILAALLSLRARKVEGSRWKPVLVGGVVFAVAELATGVLSALTGAIPIPPFLDLGTIIDGSLVVVGLVVTSLLYVRANPRRPAT